MARARSSASSRRCAPHSPERASSQSAAARQAADDGVDVLEVARAREHAQLAAVAGRGRGRCVRLARSASRRCRPVRRGGRAARRRAGRARAATRARRPRRDPRESRRAARASARPTACVDGGEPEVGDARLRDDRPRHDARIGAWRSCRKPRPRGRPEREVPARAVPDRPDAREIERRVELRERVDPGGDVEERLRPAAAVPDAPVLEVPRGEPVRRRGPRTARSSASGRTAPASSRRGPRRPPRTAPRRREGTALRCWLGSVAVAVERALDGGERSAL